MALACCWALAAGCGRQPEPNASQVASPRAAAGPSAGGPATSRAVAEPAAARPRGGTAAAGEAPGQPQPPPRRSLAELLEEPPSADAASPQLGLPSATSHIPIDDGRVAVAGIRKLHSRHLTLYTDLPQQPAIDELPEVFDLAVPQWCRYFELDPQRLADWHMTAFLIRDKPRFEAAGLIPADLPPYLNGYQQGPYLWVNDQVEDYYRRHLLLHEGTHGFMNLLLGDLGPPWYAEGIAELLATHLWQDGRLELNHFPQSRGETPGWGRIKIVQDELAATRGMMPAAILDYGPKAHLQNSAYGWCWALAAFLDGHPDYQQRFRDLRSRVGAPNFNAAFRQSVEDDWSDLQEQWQLFVLELDYGYDLERTVVQRRHVQPLPPGGATVTIDAARGWQSSGYRLEAGREYRLVAAGRYGVKETSEIWWSEPGGVTIHYHRGRPLGLLLGALRDETRPPSGLSPLTRPEPIGLERRWTPPTPGTLYLKINDSPAALHDNQGHLSLRIEPAGP